MPTECSNFDWSIIVQFLAFVGAIYTVIYQFGAQRTLQSESQKTELQLQIYESVTSGMPGASPTATAMSLSIVDGALRAAAERFDATGQYIPTPFRVEAIHTQFSESHGKLWDVLATIEKYELVAPNLPLFRAALAKKAQELGAAYATLIQRLPYYLLSENGIADPGKLLQLRGEDAAIFTALVDSFSNVAHDVAAFLLDIQTELQNALIGAFFTRTLEPRRPKDERHLVLTSQSEAMLVRVKEYVDA